MNRLMRFVLLMLMVARSQPTTLQKRVGTVYSPTQFGMIHFTHDKRELAAKGKRILAALDREIWRLNRTRGEVATVFVQDQRSLADTEIKAIIQRLDEEMTFVGQHTPARGHREKRFLAAVIAAASAIFSFGLGISTEIELKNLREMTNGLAKNQRFIVAQLVELARETEKELGLAIESFHWAFINTQINQKLVRCVDHLREDARRWTQGLYHLMAGQLDPAIVSVPDLRRGLRLVEEQARRVGMRVAPMQNRMEVLFSAPVTTYFEENVIHVWVSVPLIPEEAPVFELLHLFHQPVPMDEYLVELDAGSTYLAVDHLRRVHAPMSSTELAACDVHRQHFFCRRQSFSTETDSCPIALLRGEKPAAAALCRKFVSKALLVAAALNESEPRRTLVTVAKPTDVQRLCQHGSSQPVLWVKNQTEMEVPAGCYLQAGGIVTYLSHAPPEVVVASEGDHWKPEDVFGSELYHVKRRLVKLNITKEKLLLPVSISDSSDSDFPVWFWPTVGVLTFLLAALLLDVAARYGCLIRRRLHKKKQHYYEEPLSEREVRRRRHEMASRPAAAPCDHITAAYVNSSSEERQQMAPLSNRR
jgi:hypothetical protein